MNHELKDAIIKYVQENKQNSQLINSTAKQFTEYIYSNTGSHLIGGEAIHEFITNFIKLYV